MLIKKKGYTLKIANIDFGYQKLLSKYLEILIFIFIRYNIAKGVIEEWKKKY